MNRRISSSIPNLLLLHRTYLARSLSANRGIIPTAANNALDGRKTSELSSREHPRFGVPFSSPGGVVVVCHPPPCAGFQTG